MGRTLKQRPQLLTGLLVVVLVALSVAWNAHGILKRRAMLRTLTANGCYWRVAELRDILDRPNVVIPMARTPFGDTAVGCIFLDRSSLESRYREIGRLFPEAMMPIE